MNLSNKSQALEDAARAILEGYGYGATRGSNWKAVRNSYIFSLDNLIDTAKTTKSKNNFYIFNNKGQIYHTAPTLDKAKKHAVDYKKHPNEMGNPTILDLSKGKIVESADIKESSKAKTIKVGENAINAKSTQYVLVKDRKIVAIGEKAELLQKSKAEGRRVWIVGEHKGIGDLLESTTKEEEDDEGESDKVEPTKEKLWKELPRYVIWKDQDRMKLMKGKVVKQRLDDKGNVIFTTSGGTDVYADSAEEIIENK